MNYIDQLVFSWEHQQAQEILRICVNAYRSINNLRYLVQRTENFSEVELPWEKISVTEAWRNTLLKAGQEGHLRSLLGNMLSDNNISIHHAKLKRLLELESIDSVKTSEQPLPEALARLLNIIQRRELDLEISPDLLRAARTSQPSTLIAYRLHRIVYLLQKRFAIDKRFINLTLTYNQHDLIEPWEFDDLQNVLEALPDNPVLVLLGSPGAGKSTLLWRLERDLNEVALANSNSTQIPVPFYVSLNRYPPITPSQDISPSTGMKWLESEWQHRFPKLPPLQEIMSSHPVLFLLDGLNEMPYKNRLEQSQMIRQWRDVAYNLEISKHRLLFSCRNLDYTGSLSTPELPVPQVQIQPFTPKKIFLFLEAYVPKYSTYVWSKIKDNPSLLSFLNTPFFLNLLVEQTSENSDVPDGRAALISGFIKRALRREVKHENWLFQPGNLLGKQDYDNILSLKRSPVHVILGGANLIEKFSTLAYKMQAGTQRADGGQVRIDLDDVKKILKNPDVANILRAGVSLGIIDEDFESMDLLNYHETVAFKHQLFQEYFAARKLAEMEPSFIAKLGHVPWRVDRVEEPLKNAIAMLPVDEPLPSLPQTGWEETITLASAMISQPDRLLTFLIESNLPLAGRCIAQSDVNVSKNQKNEIQRKLIDRSKNREADLRHRISTGLILGNIGDPRFELNQGPYGKYLLPPMVEILGGKYSFGSNDADADSDERNGPSLFLNTFLLGQFPVTNAEWELFMKGDGYKNERWWETDDAKSWLRGDNIASMTKKRLREEKEWLLMNYEKLSQFTEASQDILDVCIRIAEMTNEQFKSTLDEKFPANKYREPRHWANKAFNNPLQPVVGVCLHEVQAYSAWLSVQTGLEFQIPTEFQWEAAARGFDKRVYAHGDKYEALYFNVLDTHIGRTTPIGVFPNGNTPDGLVDIIGNCWEWTTSNYKPYIDMTTDLTESNISKIVRRGSCYNGSRNIRASSRYWNSPNRRNDYLGFRLVCPISHKKTLQNS